LADGGWQLYASTTKTALLFFAIIDGKFLKVIRGLHIPYK
jgi:hypothetical protein